MKSKLEIFLKLIIFIDLIALILNFLNNYIGVDWISVSPGSKLNNPLAILLTSIFLLGWVNPEIKKRGLGYLKTFTTEAPHNYFLFTILILLQFFLVGMYLISPSESYWNLDFEKGYGTYFSTIQLFILGLTVFTIVYEKKDAFNLKPKLYEWKLIAFLFLALALDECIGIHDNVRVQIQIVQFLFNDEIASSLPHWLVLFSPIIFIIIIFLIRFFLQASKDNLKIKLAFLTGLSLWINVLVFEKIGQNHFFLLPHNLIIAIEEGSEMLGATFLILGFGFYLKQLKTATFKENSL